MLPRDSEIQTQRQEEDKSNCQKRSAEKFYYSNDSQNGEKHNIIAAQLIRSTTIHLNE